MLTASQHDELRTTGITYLRGAVPRAAADAIADRVWATLVKRGVDRDDATTWPEGFVTKHQGLRQGGVFNAFATPEVAAVVEDLLGGAASVESKLWGPALITFPSPAPWQLPTKTYHFDLPGRGDPDQPSAARLFGFVNDVVARGGGTLVVEGSHELIRRMVLSSKDGDAGGSSNLRKKLIRRHPWFAALCQGTDPGVDRTQRFMVDGDEIDGVTVRVAELTGQAGDVAVMMPWTMHNLSPNCSTQPRFMVTHSVYRADQTYWPVDKSA